VERLYRASARIARWGGAACLALVLAAGLLTVADIVLRQATGRGILGTTDITQLLILAAAFAAIPHGFFADTHVSVDLLTENLAPRRIALLKASGASLGVALLALIGAFGAQQAVVEAGYGDSTSTINIPKTWFWVWLIAGSAYAAFAAAMVALRHGLVALGQPDIGKGI
jgi:TRAP-type C4-dicarboxylate transport system permease small subunit